MEVKRITEEDLKKELSNAYIQGANKSIKELKLFIERIKKDGNHNLTLEQFLELIEIFEDRFFKEGE